MDLKRCLGVLLLVGLVVVGAQVPARADALADAARGIAGKWQGTVISIELVVKIKMSMFGSDEVNESKNEAVGTIIDPSGLVVTANSAVDAMDLFSDIFESDEEEGPKVTTEIISVKYVLPDGSSIPAQIVLRDKDLDLAFLRPVKPLAKPLPALDLTQSVEPGLFDEAIIMNRLGKVADRTIGLAAVRIQAVVEKPRRYYVLMDFMMQTGAPVFGIEGKVIGIQVLRKLPKGASSGGRFGSDIGLIPITLPAKSIVEVAKQAPQAEPKS
ncbi:MAG: S1 family peptidase [Armatimonadota bacterium]